MLISPGVAVAQQAKRGHVWRYTYTDICLLLYLSILKNMNSTMTPPTPTWPHRVHSDYPLSIPVPPLSMKKKTGSQHPPYRSLLVTHLSDLPGHAPCGLPAPPVPGLAGLPSHSTGLPNGFLTEEEGTICFKNKNTPHRDIYSYFNWALRFRME